MPITVTVCSWSLVAKRAKLVARFRLTLEDECLMVKNILKIVPVIFIMLIVAACGDKYEGDFSYTVKDFTFTDQDGDDFSKEELDGNFWVADLIFTNCTDVCPGMTANMANLQQELDDEDMNDVHLVSFTVDPERDEPEALKKYAEERGAVNFDNWHLLSEYDFDAIREVSVKSFKSPVAEIPDTDQFTHSNQFFLVSPEGEAIKRYDGNDLGEVKEIISDIKEMQ